MKGDRVSSKSFIWVWTGDRKSQLSTDPSCLLPLCYSWSFIFSAISESQLTYCVLQATSLWLQHCLLLSLKKMMMTSTSNSILHFFAAGLCSFFLLIFLFMQHHSNPEHLRAGGWWSTSSRLVPETGKGQPQMCLCPFPAPRVMILLHRWILFPPLSWLCTSPTCSSHLAAPSPGVVVAPWFLLPPLRLLCHNFPIFSVTSPANSPLKCSWYHFSAFQDEESASPLGTILALCCYSHFPPCFAPSLSSPQPGLCPEH